MGYEFIKCGAFKSKDHVVKDMLFRINYRAKCMREKAVLAEKLLQDAQVMLACGGHDPVIQDCENCRELSRRRIKLAELIISKAE